MTKKKSKRKTRAARRQQLSIISRAFRPVSTIELAAEEAALTEYYNSLTAEEIADQLPGQNSAAPPC